MILQKSAIFLLWLGAVIDPIGYMYGLRYLALATAFASLALQFSLTPSARLERSYRGALILLLSLGFPVCGLTMYYLRVVDGKEFIDTSYLASGVLIMTSLLYRSQTLCEFGVDSLVFSTRLLSLLVIAGYASQSLFFDDWLSFFTERNVALISFREYSGTTFPYIYFLASPLLIFLMAHDLYRLIRKTNSISLFVFLATTFSFALTGTRAHIVLAILFAPLYFFLTSNRKTVVNASFLFATVIFTIFIIGDTRSLLVSFFATSEISNSIKVSLLDGYIEILSNPLVLIFGQGFNAHEWSAPLRNMVAMEAGASKTELTYLELVRVFGIIVATMFMVTIVLLLRSTKNLNQGLQWIFPGFVIFLANAAINPYLFSVNGMLPLGLIASMSYHYKPTNKSRGLREKRWQVTR